jgi:hypothetical protein
MWICKSCGAQFPVLGTHLGDADRCSKCVEVDQLCVALATAQADAARWKDNARFWYAQRDYLRDVVREFLAFAEDRRVGTWDDVMRISREALSSTELSHNPACPM